MNTSADKHTRPQLRKTTANREGAATLATLPIILEETEFETVEPSTSVETLVRNDVKLATREGATLPSTEETYIPPLPLQNETARQPEDLPLPPSYKTALRMQDIQARRPQRVRNAPSYLRDYYV